MTEWWITRPMAAAVAILCAKAVISTYPLPVHLLDGPTADLQELGQFPLAHSLRPLHLDVLPVAARSGWASGRGNAPRPAPSPGRRPSVPCRTSFWSAPERSMWMTRPGWVVHKRAFVTLGHNSLPSACLGVGHKGIVQYAPVAGRAMPETYGYVGTSCSFSHRR